MAAPTTDPSRRANTADALAFLAQRIPVEHRHRILVITSAIYGPSQFLTAAPRLLSGEPAHVEVIGTPTATDAHRGLLAPRIGQEIHAAVLAATRLWAVRTHHGRGPVGCRPWPDDRRPGTEPGWRWSALIDFHGHPVRPAAVVEVNNKVASRLDLFPEPVAEPVQPTGHLRLRDNNPGLGVAVFKLHRNVPQHAIAHAAHLVASRDFTEQAHWPRSPVSRSLRTANW
jgi:hypothetical protein